MPRNMNTIPGGTTIQDGETVRVKLDGSGWESHKFADTKSDVGLSNVDNTSDVDKPVSNAVQAELNTKVDTTALAEVATTGSYDDLLNKPYIPDEAPVDSVNGQTGIVVLDHTDVGADPSGSASQALSDANEYTDTNVMALADSLSEAAFSGSYNDLSDKPSIPATQVNTDWYATSGVQQLLNKPSLSDVAISGAYSDLTGTPDLGTAAYEDSTEFATSAQGTLAETALQDDDLAEVAFSGDYNDLSNTPTITAQVQSDWAQSNSGAVDFIKNKPAYVQSQPSRSLNSAFRPSTTRNTLVSYSVKINCTANITGGQEGAIHLEISPVSDFSSGVETIATASNQNSVSLALAITAVQNVGQVIVGTVPAGYYARLRTQQVTGSPSFTYIRGQETYI